MPSRICKACKVKKANRPGVLCHTCWSAQGGEPAAVLSDDREDDLSAMTWVFEGGKVTTKQQQAFRQLLDEDGRSKFFDRMMRLGGKSVPGEVAGVPPGTPDPGTVGLVELIDRVRAEMRQP